MLARMDAQMESLASYVHEHRHGMNNVSMKVDSLVVEVAKRGAETDAKMVAHLSGLDTKIEARMREMQGQISARLDKMETRISELEDSHQRQQGERGVLSFFVSSPALGWIAALAAAVFAVIQGGR